MTQGSKIQPLVEENLPKQFIYDLGLYLQTCARIEVSCCALVCTLEIVTGGSAEWHSRFSELRKLPIKDLIKTVKSKSRKLPTGYASELVELMDWLDRYQINRHIAAHGAFYRNDTDQSLKVLYTHKKKEAGETHYRHEETEVTREMVLGFIADADRILRQVETLDQIIMAGELKLL